MNIKNEVLIRIYIVLALICIVAVIIFGKAIQISVVDGEKWRARGDSLYVKYLPVNAERGNILSEDGSLLATSLPFFEIRMDLKSTAMSDEVFQQNLDSLAVCLATHVFTDFTVGGMRGYLEEKRKKGERYLLIKKNVSYTELERISKFPLFRLGRYKGGFIVKRQSKRERPFRMLARRTIGYVREGAKPVGLEGYFDQILGGTAGKQLMQRVSHNTWIPINDLTEIEPENGNDIVSTIDVNLQDITHEALLRGLNYHQADHGTAILMEVKTGAIRAISNIGKVKNGWSELYNYAIGSATEPGSTFKLAAMMALLEDGYIKLSDSINLEQGRADFFEEVMLDASYHRLDSTTVKRAFEISSNVGIAKLVQKHYGRNNPHGEKNNGSRFIQRLKDMNLHIPLGIEIEGEASPYIKDAYSEKDGWSGTTLPWMSIGYELTITPLQLLNFYNSVANNGVMMKPYLIDQIQNFGEVKEVFKPTIIKRKIASKNTIAQAQELLAAVVSDGTARSLKSSKYNFSGKTGTAQINYRKFKPKANIRYQASFAGYFPSENPMYSCIVVITDPKQNGIYGSEVALPVFREIADRCFATKIQLHEAINLTPKPKLTNNKLPVGTVGKVEDLAQVMDQIDLTYYPFTKKEWGVLNARSDSLRIQSRTLSKNVVPNVNGMGLRDALFVLENRGLSVSINGYGKVVRQSIKPGTTIKGQTIKITLR